MINERSVRLDVGSAFEMIDLVQVVAGHLCRAAGFDDDATHQISLAVRECVINAIRHGNKSDPAKRVHIEFTPADDGGGHSITIRVRDEGDGFDPAGVPDHESPEDILSPGGRGLVIIRGFMDELRLRRAPEGGMEVVMTKRAEAQSA